MIIKTARCGMFACSMSALNSPGTRGIRVSIKENRVVSYRLRLEYELEYEFSHACDEPNAANGSRSRGVNPRSVTSSRILGQRGC